MIELNNDQEQALRLPSRQRLIDEASSFTQENLENVYAQRNAEDNTEVLALAYDKATGFGITQAHLIKKYMIYSLSAPALLESETIDSYFTRKDKSADLLAKDLFALLELPSARGTEEQR